MLKENILIVRLWGDFNDCWRFLIYVSQKHVATSLWIYVIFAKLHYRLTNSGIPVQCAASNWAVSQHCKYTCESTKDVINIAVPPVIRDSHQQTRYRVTCRGILEWKSSSVKSVQRSSDIRSNLGVTCYTNIPNWCLFSGLMNWKLSNILCMLCNENVFDVVRLGLELVNRFCEVYSLVWSFLFLCMSYHRYPI